MSRMAVRPGTSRLAGKRLRLQKYLISPDQKRFGAHVEPENVPMAHYQGLENEKVSFSPMGAGEDHGQSGRNSGRTPNPAPQGVANATAKAQNPATKNLGRRRIRRRL